MKATAQHRFYKAALTQIDELLLTCSADTQLSQLQCRAALVGLQDIVFYLEYIDNTQIKDELIRTVRGFEEALAEAENVTALENHLRSFRNRYTEIVSPRIRVDFIINRVVHWKPCRKLIEAFQAEDGCQVNIVPVPYLASRDDEYAEAMRRRVAADGFDFLDFNEYDIEAEMPDIVFVNQPYDLLKPRGFRFFRMHDLVDYTVYWDYAPQVGLNVAGAFSEGAFGAWQVILASDVHVAAFAFLRRTRGNLLALGAPDADIGYDAQHAAVRGIDVLWNPFMPFFHSQIPWAMRQFGLLESMAIRFPQIVNRVRLHHFYMDNLFSRMCAEHIFKLSDRYDNLVIDDSADFYEALDQSQAFITGPGTSTILSALAYGIPVLQTYNTIPDVHVTDIHMLAALYTGRDAEDFAAFYEMLLEGRDPKREMRARAVKQYLTVVDGTACQRITREIIRLYQSEEGQTGG